MSEPSCFDCGKPSTHTRLPHAWMCKACRRRRHYHPQPCPDCGATRPLAYQSTDRNHDRDGNRIVCASCAGAESVFACHECGQQHHPYGATRCARCILRERLTELLTDPGTGQIHTRLRPVFNELVNSERPQTGIWWLRKQPGIGPQLLGQMARGELDISHDTFRALPSDRTHNYLRELLASVDVLPAYEPRIERIPPWLDQKLAPLPTDHADLVRRFTHWHVLRHLRNLARQQQLTKSVTDNARDRKSEAIRFLAYLHAHGATAATAATATQEQLERYQISHAVSLASEYTFITWLRRSRINTRLRIPYVPAGPPTINISDEQRWQHVERLLHDHTLRSYTRLGGLFTLLFAQPLSRIVAMRTNQVTICADRRVDVAFSTIPVQMPTVVDQIIRDHLQQRGKSLYASRGTQWLFPGGKPGRHLETENIRSQLVAIGIKPYESRKAALFQLAGEMPAPVLAELLGIPDTTAADWAKLAARDWTGYIADRAP